MLRSVVWGAAAAVLLALSGLPFWAALLMGELFGVAVLAIAPRKR